ncbi:MAG TPA: VCBS repeat-containing protein [Acidimicrobiales bacterium]|nr:VCBS repeat-containing protein [Acidimicrobiales bacterium]
MLRNRRLFVASRTVLAVASAAAAVGLVAAHVASGPAATAADDDLVLTGPERDGSPHVRTFRPNGAPGGVEISAAGTSVSGATVAVGDITGDGVAEIVTGSGEGTSSALQVWSRDGKTMIAQTAPFGAFQGGVNVATAAIDGAAGHEIIVGAGPGGGPHVRILKLSGATFSEVSGFFAYDQGFRGGVFVAGAPGLLVTGAGAGGGPHIQVFGVSPTGERTTQAGFMAFEGRFPGGARVAVGEVDGDAALEVVVGAGRGGGPRVQVFNSDGSATGVDFFAYAPAFTGGVWVATASAVRNPGDRIITGAGPGGAPHVRVLGVTGTSITEVVGFYAYVQEFAGGVRVAGFPAASGNSGTTTTTAGGATTTGGAGATTTTAPCTGTRLPNGTCVPAGGTTTTTGSGGTTTTAAGGATTTTAAPTTTTAAPATTTTAGPGASTTTTACDGTVVGSNCVPVP